MKKIFAAILIVLLFCSCKFYHTDIKPTKEMPIGIYYISQEFAANVIRDSIHIWINKPDIEINEFGDTEIHHKVFIGITQSPYRYSYTIFYTYQDLLIKLSEEEIKALKNSTIK